MTQTAWDAAEEGMELADSAADPYWKIAAEICILKVASANPYWIIDAVHDLLDSLPVKTHTTAALGPILLRLSKKGIITGTDETWRSERVPSHGRFTRVWTSPKFGINGPTPKFKSGTLYTHQVWTDQELEEIMQAIEAQAHPVTHPLWNPNRACAACPLREKCQGPVPGDGPSRARIMFIGEAPGKNEDEQAKPFVGDSGEWLDILMRKNGIDRRECYITNVVKCRPPGNRDPLPAEVEACAPRWLYQEIRMVQPEIVVTLGAYATKLLTGMDETMEHFHAVPLVDVTLPNGYVAPVVFPSYHPAAGFTQTRLIRLINNGMEKLGRLVKGEKPRDLSVKDIFPNPYYWEAKTVSDVEDHLQGLYAHSPDEVIGLDTETVNDKLWSVQISSKPGTAMFVPADIWGEYTLKQLGEQRPIFRPETLVYVHNYLYDARILGWGENPALAPAKWVDSMVMAYLLGLPKGLKTLARDLCGIEMHSYEDMVLPIHREKLREYITRIIQAVDLPPSPKRGAFKGKGSKVRYDLALASYETWVGSDSAPKPLGDPPILVSQKWNDKKGIIAEKETKPLPILGKLKRLMADGIDHGADPIERWDAFHPLETWEIIQRFGPPPEASIADVPREVAVPYSARDADATRRVGPILWEMILDKGEGLDQVLTGLDLPVHPPVLEMGKNGMGVNTDDLREISQRLTQSMAEKALAAQAEASRLMDVSGGLYGDAPRYVFNPNSDVQVGKLIYEDLRYQSQTNAQVAQVRPDSKLKPFKLTDGGLPSTDEKHLKMVSRMFPHMETLINYIVEYKKELKLKTTYADKLPQWAREDTSGGLPRIHARINTTNVETGRFSTNDPNIMSIPTRSDLGREVRDAFQAREGFSFMAIDYSQIEMRLMMHLAQCVAGLKLLNDGRDIHTETAAKMYQVALLDVTTDMRYIAKTLGFGVIYGLSPYGLYNQLIEDEIEGYSQDDCREFIRDYFQVYPEVKEFQKAQARYADIHWEIRDMWGRVRAIPEMSVPIRRIKGQGERQAYNMPVQSGAQGILKLAMVRIWQKYPQYHGMVKWLLQFHDELIWECPDGMVGHIAPLYAKEMESVVELNCPIIANIKTGKKWGSLREWE